MAVEVEPTPKVGEQEMKLEANFVYEFAATEADPLLADEGAYVESLFMIKHAFQDLFGIPPPLQPQPLP